jgi:hypothetical protein
LPADTFKYNPAVLTFGYCFNQSLSKESIPSNVTDLTFGYYFNQPLIKGSIPLSVTYLTFGYSYNQQTIIPNSVSKIKSNIENFNCFIEIKKRNKASFFIFFI